MNRFEKQSMLKLIKNSNLDDLKKMLKDFKDEVRVSKYKIEVMTRMIPVIERRLTKLKTQKKSN